LTEVEKLAEEWMAGECSDSIDEIRNDLATERGSHANSIADIDE